MCGSERVQILGSLLLVAAALGLHGCVTATLDPPQRTQLRDASVVPPVAQLSPTLELAKVKTASDVARVIIDASGNAHVVLSLKVPREVRHIVVGADGVLEREIVCSGVQADSLDAAFDRSGTLHILIDGNHYVKTNGGWRGGERTPWQDAGLRVRGAGFVDGASDLTWQFLVRGKDIGAPGRWDWQILAAGPGAPAVPLIWPWHSRPDKLVVVRESNLANPVWTVIDPTDQLGIKDRKVAENAEGAIEVLYQASGAGALHQGSEHRYAHFKLNDFTGGDNLEVRDSKTRFRKFPLRQVSGAKMTLPAGATLSQGIRGENGWLFVEFYGGRSFRVRNAQWDSGDTLPAQELWPIRLASAGDEDFHAITTGQADHERKDKNFSIRYLVFRGGRWSAPMDLGVADVGSSGRWSPGFLVEKATNVGSAGNERAFAVWPTTGGFVGRWIVLEKR